MIAIRPANLRDEAERAFIRSTWSRAFKVADDAGMIHTDDWSTVMHRQIDRVLDRPDARALLAYESDEPSFWYGWIAGDTSGAASVVFFSYVKEPYRRQGIARDLFARFGLGERTPFMFVCRTPMVAKLKHKVPFARYNPREVRYPKETRQA